MKWPWRRQKPSEDEADDEPERSEKAGGGLREVRVVPEAELGGAYQEFAAGAAETHGTAISQFSDRGLGYLLVVDPAEDPELKELFAWRWRASDAEQLTGLRLSARWVVFGDPPVDVASGPMARLDLLVESPLSFERRFLLSVDDRRDWIEAVADGAEAMLVDRSLFREHQPPFRDSQIAQRALPLPAVPSVSLRSALKR